MMLSSIEDFRFTCETCGEKLPDNEIGVMKVDLSPRHGGPPGSCTRNINYCLEKARCRAGARRIARDCEAETERMARARDDA